MTEVRGKCGVICNGCSYFQNKCQGCTNEKENFKGRCEVKVCCESQNIEHCGKCLYFPCENLEYLAYDNENGDNGERLRNCSKWKLERK